MEYWAHSKENSPEAEWQTIEQHAENVAVLAEKAAKKFDAARWGYTVGRLHDLGKYKMDFQEKLRGKHIHVDHAVSGALWAVRDGIKNKAYAKLLAYCIAGHHTGLPDGTSGTDDTCLENRLRLGTLPSILPVLSIPELETPSFVKTAMDEKRAPSGFSSMFFTRMLFSCLKDADCLDTEGFLDPDKSTYRGNYLSLPKLKIKFDTYLQTRFNQTDSSTINQLRNRIRNECVQAACKQPGLYSLSVPTGGGKTLSSMAFALEHAIQYELERIIYVIPYTSIIEQTAREFKTIFGADSVIEHHCNYTAEISDDDYQNKIEQRRLLATENWDAPIIVTTNVQFFESLFNNKTSRVRKIYNIAKSVVILDEAQMLPVPLLKPTVEAIKELSERYHTSIVLCTATQPTLQDTELKDGLRNVREIASDLPMLERAFKRVHPIFLGERTDKEILRLLKQHSQVMCIVNTRDHARMLYISMGEEEGHFHLSALMCPEHRSRMLAQIKQRLGEAKECRVISTQLVEAGVDIDFPVVYRTIAGLDSIVQAAGRCNREGKLKNGGAVYVFIPETGLPKGVFRQPAQITETLLSRFPERFLSSEAVRAYFSELFWIKSLGNSLDEKRILEDCKYGEANLDLPFKTVAGKYRLIEQLMESVIVPFDKIAKQNIDALRSEGPKRDVLRSLQRYTVGIYPNQFQTLKNEGIIETIHETYHTIYAVRLKDVYKDTLGLNPDNKEFCDPESLCV